MRGRQCGDRGSLRLLRGGISKAVSFFVLFEPNAVDWLVWITPGEDVHAFSPGFPLGEGPPVGASYVKGTHRRLASGRRPRRRVCLRKGCGCRYQPRCWNQRYCRNPECQRLVRRWQAARRQAKRRQSAAGKAQHAQAEKARRQRAKRAAQAVDKPAVAPARGHAAQPFRSAVMRSARLPRISRELHPQPGTLLLFRVPAGGSECPRSRTQVAFSRHLGWPEEAGH